MNTAQFYIPAMPVPLHACFVNVRKNGRADSERYQQFKRTVDADLAKHIPHILGTPYKATFSDDVCVTYTVGRPDKRKRDLDNLCKSLNDSLTRNFILKDDSQIVDLRVKWVSPPSPYGWVFVEIFKANLMEQAA